LLEAYQASQAFAPIKAPKSLNDRYIIEDLPYGSAFFASLGDMLSVPMEATKNIIALGSLMTGRNLAGEGVTMATLGLDSLSKEELLEFLYTGKSTTVSW
jgi:opine dehydrogenase